MLSREGCLSLYAGEDEFRADREHVALLERFGFPHEVLGRDAIRDLERDISPEIGRAVLLPQNRSVRDPYRLVVALTERFRGLGGGLETGEVVGFERSGDAIRALRLAGGRRIAVSEAILCAGAHTGRLSKLFGDPIPLETERGYHTQIMAPGIVAAPFDHLAGARLHGHADDRRPARRRNGGDGRPRRAAGFPARRVLVRRARDALPRLQAHEVTERMGHRPALPDTIPVIGPSPGTRGISYATGHGHLGVTYAATTARLVADLVTGLPPPIDTRPYRVDQF